MRTPARTAADPRWAAACERQRVLAHLDRPRAERRAAPAPAPAVAAWALPNPLFAAPLYCAGMMCGFGFAAFWIGAALGVVDHIEDAFPSAWD